MIGRDEALENEPPQTRFVACTGAVRIAAGERSHLTALIAAWPTNVGDEIWRFLDGSAVGGKTS